MGFPRGIVLCGSLLVDVRLVLPGGVGTDLQRPAEVLHPLSHEGVPGLVGVSVATPAAVRLRGVHVGHDLGAALVHQEGAARLGAVQRVDSVEPVHQEHV